ncbi:helix-hairpin-helix domain-containing protein [Flavobacteriaceae bacterium KMM 6897]|nr:helix-hairpin-helix domain-containing protein [Flavobacteriaceae bacterium KMM 6897]
MRKKERTSHFRFNKRERNGMFFLLAIILVLQIGYFYLKIYPVPVESSFFPDKDAQNKIEAMRAVREPLTLFPFNPNFISDHKGYVLGMSVIEIDRLHAYRAEGKYVNSISDFQQVTQINDSLLIGISPFFKFPEWTEEKGTSSSTAKTNQGFASKKVKIISVRDLNTVTAEELKIVRGIGDKLSVRIIKFRDRLGGFLQEGQLYHVYGLEREVASRVLDRFKLLSKPQVAKINVNSASSDELSQLIYIPYALSKAIVAYRERNGDIASFEELKEIQGFPADRIDIIKLYLSL